MAQQVELRDGYIAIVFSGTVDRETVRGALEGRDDVLRAIGRTRKVLFDFCGMTSFDFDPYQLGESMRRLAGNGIRLAICSSNPEYFGVARQIAQFSGVEGAAIAVFRAEGDAVGWLAGLGE